MIVEVYSAERLVAECENNVLAQRRTGRLRLEDGKDIIKEFEGE